MNLNKSFEQVLRDNLSRIDAFVKFVDGKVSWTSVPSKTVLSEMDLVLVLDKRTNCFKSASGEKLEDINYSPSLKTMCLSCETEREFKLICAMCLAALGHCAMNEWVNIGKDDELKAWVEQLGGRHVGDY